MKYAEVIGDPIKQSKSPLIHGFWLKALGLDGDYRATRVTPEGLADYFAARAADPDWLGCNITIPHKETALAFVEDRGGVKESIGAINLAFRSEGALVGTNTDAAGFYAPISGTGVARFTLALFLPLLFTASAVFHHPAFDEAAPYGPKWSVRFDWFVLATLALDVPFSIWPRLLTTYGGF